MTLRPLDEPCRQRLLHFAAMLCAVPILLAPIAARSAFESRVEQAAFADRLKIDSITASLPAPKVTVIRDPFVSSTRIVPAATGSFSSSHDGVVGMRVVQGAPMGIAVPQVAMVRAVVTGASARALVEEGGHVSIVSIGDRLSGSPIVRIDADGVTLKSGVLLPISEQRL